MKLKKLVAMSALLFGSQTAFGALLFDQNVTPDYFNGSGNANGSFTVDRNGDIELGLRGKLRHNAAGAPENTFNSQGDGTYEFDAGVAPTQSAPTAVWSFEWSINSQVSDTTGTPSTPLDTFTYVLGLDLDAGIGTNFVTFDPINGVNDPLGRVQWDHKIGNNNTTGNGGTSISNGSNDPGGYQTLISNNNVAQQSWKPHWFMPGFDPAVDGQYDFYLAAFDGNNELARSEISIIVGNGAAQVSAPGALAFLGLGVVGLGLARRRKLAK